MGVDEAASDAKGDDVGSRNDDSDVNAGDGTDDNAERAGQPKKVGEYGRRGVYVTPQIAVNTKPVWGATRFGIRPQTDMGICCS